MIRGPEVFSPISFREDEGEDEQTAQLCPTFFDEGKSTDLEIGVLIASQINGFGREHKLDNGTTFKSPLVIFELAVISNLADVHHCLNAASRTYSIEEQKEKERGFIHAMSDIHSELDMIQSVLGHQEGVFDAFLEDTKWDWNEALKYASRPADGWLIVERARRTRGGYELRIEKIHRDAERVEKTIESYLNLKRTYVTIEDTRNGLMVGYAASAFAFVTVIFTPLAFMTSLFALPMDQFVQHQITDSTSTTRVFRSSYIGGYTGMSTVRDTC